MRTPDCPFCTFMMKEFVPLVYAGDGVHSFKCDQPDCEYHVVIAVREKEDGDANRS